MTSTPMTLEDALRFNGYTIDVHEVAGKTIETEGGQIVVPAMILSGLTWHRTEPATLGSAFYLDKLPAFHQDYRPVQLSLILDRFRSRRLAYDTPDEFGLAVRRWGNLNLGAMSTLIRRYLSTAIDLPLDTVDLIIHGETSASTTDDGASSGTATDSVTSTDTTATTSKGRDAQSEFPQGTLADNADYASGAVDRVGTGNVSGTGTTAAERGNTAEDHRATTANGEDTRTEKGRTGRSVMELLEQQRAMFLNVDAELLDTMEPLFLGVFDRSTVEPTFSRPYGRGWGW